MNPLYPHRFLKKFLKRQRGDTLISLLVALVAGAFLLVALMQTVFLVNQTYITIKNVSGIYENGRQAIDYLRQEIVKAGYGMTQPSYDSSVTTTNGSGINTVAHVFKNWTYIGTYQDNPSRLFSTALSANTTDACRGLMETTTYPYPFFGMQDGNQGWALPSSSVNKYTSFSGNNSKLSYFNTSSYNATACSAETSNTYNCGGSWSNAVYERVMHHILVPGDAYPPSSNPPPPSAVGTAFATLIQGGSIAASDQLTIAYNSDGTSLTPADAFGTAVPLSTSPTNTRFPDVYNTFGIGSYTPPGSTTAIPVLQALTQNNVNSTLTQANSGKPVPVVSNVEFMYILLGEDTYGAGSPTRYVPMDDPSLDPKRIVSVRVYIVVRSEDALFSGTQTPPPLPSLLPAGILGSSNSNWSLTYAAPADGCLRKLFSTTIYLKNAHLAPIQAQCALSATGKYFVQTAGVPAYGNTLTAGSSNLAAMGYYCRTSNASTCDTYASLASCDLTRNFWYFPASGPDYRKPVTSAASGIPYSIPVSSGT